jgi:hypothetical protein
MNPCRIGCWKFSLKPDPAQYAILIHKNYHPIFGYDHTIIVHNNCSTRNGNSTRLYDDVNDTGLNQYANFTGEQYLTVQEIEAFGMTKRL